MSVKDSQIRQVFMEYLRHQPEVADPRSDRSIAFENYTGPRGTGILDMCREKIQGFADSDQARFYEVFYELSLERIIVPASTPELISGRIIGLRSMGVRWCRMPAT